MKRLVKYFSRKFTLLEHDIIVRCVYGKSSIPEIFYTCGRDISRNGIADVYITEKDLEDNRVRIYKAAEKDNKYVDKMLEQGLIIIKSLRNRPEDLPKRIPELSNKEIINELYKLIDIFFQFGGYLDFTHHLGGSGTSLTKKQITQLGKFHDYRNVEYRDFLLFFSRVTNAIAKKMDVKSENLDFLSVEEIIKLLSRKLTPKYADELQRIRRKRYIAIWESGKFKIITDNFKKEAEKIVKMVVTEESKKISGISILRKPSVRGEVQVINQKTPLKEILKNRIIVLPMTLPSMVPVLKHVKAIITDEGGLLCHAANIAREFGVIAIIGTKIATKVLKDGDMVEVDANNGIVKIIK